VEPRFRIRLVDPARQIYDDVWKVDIPDRGRRDRLKMIERNCAVLPQEFLLFIKSLSVFEFVGCWKDWDLSKPIESDSEADRSVVLVMRK
jgi:hypothetical protein